MKICIVGAGAIGGYLGVKLIKAGLDVSLVARGAHLEAMKKKGLTIIENEKETVCFPKCSENMEELGKMNFIFITLKAYSIPGVVKEIAKMFDENTSVINALFQRCLSRLPTSIEQKAMLNFYQKTYYRFESGQLDASAFAGTSKGDIKKHATWTALARVLLNTHEFITRN